ncbi:MAG: adenylyl-sulfate kinase [Planctomycetes bacterium]|nr:adenylyl-sulfate kinase [Planctomycetota bacterium]
MNPAPAEPELQPTGGGGVVWITGLPSAGKSTLAEALAAALRRAGRAALVLDGDRLRAGLSRDLGFAHPARTEQVRRAAEIARIAAEQEQIAIAALVSPIRADRATARAIAAPLPFIEVWLDATPALCRSRDPKGLWADASAGRRSGLTGHDAPYEAPERPELRLDAAAPVAAHAEALLAALRKAGLIPAA